MSPADSSNAAVACDVITQLSPATKQLQIGAPAFAGSYLHNNYPNQRMQTGYFVKVICNILRDLKEFFPLLENDNRTWRIINGILTLDQVVGHLYVGGEYGYTVHPQYLHCLGNCQTI